MDVCLFCGEAVTPSSVGRELVWVDTGGASSCTTAGATGSHYPGREADLFWRGSEVVDLTGAEPAVELTEPSSRTHLGGQG